MNPDELIHRLKELNAVDPDQAVSCVESLVDAHSVLSLAQVLRKVYEGTPGADRIDWHFTVLQWKLGQCACVEFQPVSPRAKLKIWTFPISVSEGRQFDHKRFTTCLPFEFAGPKGETHAS